jgi:hypothetical protein
MGSCGTDGLRIAYRFETREAAGQRPEVRFALPDEHRCRSVKSDRAPRGGFSVAGRCLTKLRDESSSEITKRNAE